VHDIIMPRSPFNGVIPKVVRQIFRLPLVDFVAVVCQQFVRIQCLGTCRKPPSGEFSRPDPLRKFPVFSLLTGISQRLDPQQTGSTTGLIGALIILAGLIFNG